MTRPRMPPMDLKAVYVQQNIAYKNMIHLPKQKVVSKFLKSVHIQEGTDHENRESLNEQCASIVVKSISIEHQAREGNRFLIENVHRRLWETHFLYISIVTCSSWPLDLFEDRKFELPPKSKGGVFKKLLVEKAASLKMGTSLLSELKLTRGVTCTNCVA